MDPLPENRPRSAPRAGTGRIRGLTPLAALVAALLYLGGAPGRANDGSLDPSFGNSSGARALAYDLGSPFEDGCGDLAPAPDGTLLVGGTSSSQFGDFDWMVTRLAADGTTILARQLFFDLGGANEDRLGAIAFDAAGRALVAGSARAADRVALRVCRLDSSTLGNDPGWNSGSCVALDLGAGTEVEVRRVAPSPDGGVLVAGSVLQPNLPNPDLNWYVLKLDSTGALDFNFGFFGIRVLAWNVAGPNADRLFDMVVDPRSGALFVAGQVPTPSVILGRIAKLSPAGNLDQSFAFGGSQDLLLSHFPFVRDTTAAGLALDPLTGTIWVALQADDPPNARLLAQEGVAPDGQLSDPTYFAWSGTDATSEIRRVVRQSDGKFVIYGDSESGSLFEAARFTPYEPTFASWDPTFGVDARVEFDTNALGWGVGRRACSAELEAGRLVVTGDSHRPDVDELVARFTSALIFEDRFETADLLEWSAAAQ